MKRTNDMRSVKGRGRTEESQGSRRTFNEWRLGCGALILASAFLSTAPAVAQQKTGPGLPADDSLTWHGITLYGVIDIGIQYDTHSAPFTPYRPSASGNIVRSNDYSDPVGLTPSNMGQSRVGLQGIEPLISDLSAVFQVETFFNPQSGEIADALKSLSVNNGRPVTSQNIGVDGSSAGQAFQTSFVGIKSARFGTLTLGRQTTLLNEGTIKYDPNYNSTAFGLLGASNTYSGAGSSETNRLDSTLKYYLSYNDLVHGAVLYKFSGSTGAARTAVQADIGGQYAGLSVDAYYSKINSAVTGSALSAAQVAAASSGVFAFEFHRRDRLGQYDVFAHGVVQLRSVQVLRRLHSHQVCEPGDPIGRRIHRHRRLRTRLRQQYRLQPFEDCSGVLDRRSIHRSSRTSI